MTASEGDVSVGAAGSFHADGTASWSSDWGIGFPTYGSRKNVWWSTLFIYGKYQRVCKPCPICRTTVSYYARVDGFAGGEKIQTRGITAPATPSKYCVPFLAGGYFYHDYGTAITWSAGVNVAPLGFDASAQTGYSANAHVYYTFSKNRHVCGTNWYPGGAAQDVVRS